MRRSKLFLQTQKNLPKDEPSPSAQMLLRAGFIDKLMSGSYSFLPLGERVLKNIENVIREEMNKIGAQEVSLPLLHSSDIWEESGRWDSANDVMFKIEDQGKKYALAFTHEEVVLDILRKRTISYKDLPIALYQFSNKFRNEPRAKSGLLRTIEFGMKDLYSAHETEEDMQEYYEQVQVSYKKIFERLGLPVRIAEASGGEFTDSYTHEFQLLNDIGEDVIYFCESCDWAQNKEIASVKKGDKCPDCGDEVQISQSIEVANTFKLGTYYSEKLRAKVTSMDGTETSLWFASYGIGTSRLVGAIAEHFHDDKGLRWPKEISPFQYHLLALGKSSDKADEVYKYLRTNKIEVLFDDREDVSSGEKLTEADLLGISCRLVVSDKTADDVELKLRNETDSRLVKMNELINL